eukprot:scaffold13142_cov15-Tisochrysis_lutea.AAC.1
MAFVLPRSLQRCAAGQQVRTNSVAPRAHSLQHARKQARIATVSSPFFCVDHPSNAGVIQALTPLRSSYPSFLGVHSGSQLPSRPRSQWRPAQWPCRIRGAQ